MRREYNIAWNKNQRSKLNSAARKYNNAIRKAIRENPMAADFLPAEVSYKELKASITTARALKNTVNRLNRITRPKALEFVKQSDNSIVTRYERHEFSVLKSVRERRKAQAAKMMKEPRPSQGRMGSLKQAQYAPDTRKASELSAGGLRRFLETQEKLLNQSAKGRVREYADRYLKTMQSVFGGFADFDEAMEGVENKIDDLYENDPEYLEGILETAPDIGFLYSPLERAAKAGLMVEFWSGV